MLQNRLTLIAIPSSSGESRQIVVPVWWVATTALVVLSLLFGTLFLASQFLGDQVDRAEMVRLQQENEQLAQKFEQLRWDIAETDVRFGSLVQKEIALRAIFDMPEIDLEERQLGIGGPVQIDVEVLSATEQLAMSTEIEVDRLLRLSRFELQKYGEVETHLGDLKDRLDHTPSIWPTKGWNSRGYGMKFDPFTGYKQFHRGIDIASGTGTPIIATADGRIKKTGRFGGMGKMVVIDHGYGFVTRYSHLSSINVKRGQRVKRGDVIAKMGSTGYSTGPHLHYEVWRNNNVKNPRDFILNTK